MPLNEQGMPIPRGHSAVMNMRVEPNESADLFCTPPWATRALMEVVLPDVEWKRKIIWDPAAGLGHMSRVLWEYAKDVFESDKFDYGSDDVIENDFLEHEVHPMLRFANRHVANTDWIIVNPPFKLALDFTLKALARAKEGVAILARGNWQEGGERCRRLFQPHPPAIVAPFSERVPMVQGRWDPKASTATHYSWFVWRGPKWGGDGWDNRTTWRLIPKGTRKALTRDDDVKRFT